MHKSLLKGGNKHEFSTNFPLEEEKERLFIYYQKIYLFKDAEKPLIESLISQTERQTFKRKEIIKRENEECREMIIVMSGQIECAKEGKRMNVLYPGQHMGENTLCATQYTTEYTVQALIKGELGVLSKHSFMKVLQSYPIYKERIFRIYENKLSEERINNLTLLDEKPREADEHAIALTSRDESISCLSQKDELFRQMLISEPLMIGRKERSITEVLPKRHYSDLHKRKINGYILTAPSGEIEECREETKSPCLNEDNVIQREESLLVDKYNDCDDNLNDLEDFQENEEKERVKDILGEVGTDLKTLSYDMGDAFGYNMIEHENNKHRIQTISMFSQIRNQKKNTINQRMQQTMFALNKCIEIANECIPDNPELQLILAEIEEWKLKDELTLLKKETVEKEKIKITTYKTLNNLNISSKNNPFNKSQVGQHL